MIELTDQEKAFLLHLLQSQQVRLLDPNAAAVVALCQSIAAKLTTPTPPEANANG